MIWRPDFCAAVRELIGHEHVVESVTFATEAMLLHLHKHRKAPPPLPASMLVRAAQPSRESAGAYCGGPWLGSACNKSSAVQSERNNTDQILNCDEVKMILFLRPAEPKRGCI